jgi:hypothetical protein
MVAVSLTRIGSESVTTAVERKEEEHEEHLHNTLGSRTSLGPGQDGTRTTLLDGTCCLYGSALCQWDGDHGWTFYRWDRVPGLGGSRGGERGQDLGCQRPFCRASYFCAEQSQAVATVFGCPSRCWLSGNTVSVRSSLHGWSLE